MILSIRQCKNPVVGILFICCALMGCQTPTTRLLGLAERNGFEYETVDADGFSHLVVRNKSFQASSTLHIYLEGDGSPWRYRHMIMPDPTPRSPLMLQLMKYDPLNAVYVGRPCYNGFFNDAGCHSDLWTSARYSSTVISSMSNVIHTLIERHKVSKVRLFGHSGGGALAMLLAARLQRVTDVVTVAGNLNVTAWTDHHQYTPLYSSLDPARQPPLRSSITQWHLVGTNDSVVPAELVKPFIQRQKSAYGVAVSDYSHGCCWGKLWGDVVRAVQDNQPGRLPGIRFKYPDEESPAGDRTVGFPLLIHGE